MGMYKKIISLVVGLAVSFSGVYADDAEQIARIDTLIQKELTLKIAIEGYMENRGTIPTLALLQANGYISGAFSLDNTFGGMIDFVVTNNNIIEINTGINTSTANIATTPLNYLRAVNFVDGINREPYTLGTVEYARYELGEKAIKNSLALLSGLASYVGDEDPLAYTTPTDGQLWYSSTNGNYYDVYFFSTGENKWVFDNSRLTSNGVLTDNPIFTLKKFAWEYLEPIGTLQVDAVKCPVSGSTYNPTTDKCEGYTKSAISSDAQGIGATAYSLGRDKFYKTITAPSGYIYDKTENVFWTEKSGGTSTSAVKLDLMYSDCQLSAKKYADAKTYCLNLVEGGYSDWRLPALSEVSRVKTGKIYSGVVGGVPSCSKYTWTSTSAEFDVSSGYYTWLGSSSDHEDGGSAVTRCVRKAN